jgi:hypothetical protein
MASATQAMKGMQTLLSLFDTLPKATEQEIKVDLPKIAADVLAAQKQEVPIHTGDLWRGLSIQVLNGGWKIRVGLVGSTSRATGKTSYGLYYGRFVEFGRRGQTVRVQRRRRIAGRLRSSRGHKLAGDIVASYSMKVPAAAARPFVYSAAAEGAALTGAENLADFWDNVLARAGGGA